MLKIYNEIDLCDFEFWGGATEVAKYLDDDDFAVIENYFLECYDEYLTETEINDFVWFEDDYIAELLDYDDFEDLVKQKEENDIVIWKSE